MQWNEKNFEGDKYRDVSTKSGTFRLTPVSGGFGNPKLIKSFGTQVSSPTKSVPGAIVGWDSPFGGGNKITSAGGLNQEYQKYYNTLGDPTAGQVEGGAAQGLFYNPTGKKGGFQSLTSSALSDPTVYGNVTKMFKDASADKAWGDVLGKYNPAALKTPGGSSHGLTEGVLKKMWT